MTFEYDATDPKLARGLVREELRPLKASQGKPVHQNLVKFMVDLRNRYMPPTLKFSTPTAAKMRQLLIREATKSFRPLLSFKDKVFLENDDPKKSEVQGFFYWFPSAHSVTEVSKGSTFQSTFVELRCMRISTSRRRLVLDDTFCHFIINEHMLIRMLERGVTNKRPLATLAEDLDRLLPASTIMALSFKADKTGQYPHVLLPFRDGVILCKISIFMLENINQGRSFRFRAVADGKSTKSGDMTMESLLVDHTKDGDGAICVYGATFIANERLSTEQVWAKMQIESLLDQEGERLQDYAKLMYLPEEVKSDMPDRLKALLVKVDTITKNHRWKVATSATLMQNS